MCIHPLSIEAISPTGQCKAFFIQHLGIHPLSIEAISPTQDSVQVVTGAYDSIHPLSIEAISPTFCPAT